MSEDTADIIFEERRKGTSYLLLCWYAVLKELCGNRNPEYVKKKMAVILIELEKIWNDRI